MPDPAADYRRVWSDLRANFWAGGPDGHCVWTWFGFASEQTAAAADAPTHSRNAVRDRAAQHGTPELWNRTQLMDVVYWHYRYKGLSDAERVEAARMMGGDFAEVVRLFGLTTIAQADGNPSINSSDDPGAQVLYYLQVHEVTGDHRAIDVAGSLIISARNRFRSPNDSADGLYYWPESWHRPPTSSLYESWIATACLQRYQRRGDPNFLRAAVNAYGWMRRRLWHPAVPTLGWPEGGYYCELDLDPRHTDPTAYHSYLRPLGWNVPDLIHRGHSVAYSGGSMGMAVLAALLYRETGDQAYRRDVVQTVRGILAKFTVEDTTLSHRVLLNDRDAWTEAYSVPAFVAEVLLPFRGDEDAGGVMEEMLSVIANTAASIMANCRTPDGYYSADWHRGAPGDSTWTMQGQRPDTADNIGMAVAQQMMTSAQAALVVLAAAIAVSGVHAAAPGDSAAPRPAPASPPAPHGPAVSESSNPWLGIVPGPLRPGLALSFSGCWAVDRRGGTLTGEAVAVSCRPDTADVFVADAGGTLHHVFYGGEHGGVFRQLPGAAVAGRPTAVAVGALHRHVFARGVDGTLQHCWGVVGRPWSAWETIPVRVTDDPTAAVRDGDEISVAYRDARGRPARVVARPGEPWRVEGANEV